MRFRLMYLFTFILSAVTIYQFNDSTRIMGLFSLLSYVFIIFGVVMSIFFIILTNTGAAAALRRSRQYGSTIGKSFLWIFVTSVICLAIVYLGNMFYNVTGFNIDSYSRMYLPSTRILGDNNIIRLAGMQQVAFGIILMSVLFSFLFGYFLKPDLRIIRPAYSVMNSITEVGFRFMGAICKIYIVFLFFISGAFFAKILSEGNFSKLIAHTKPLLIELGILTGVLVIIVLPIIYAIFTKCKENPIPVMWSALITSIISVFTGNIMFTLPIMEVIHRTENNSMKKTTVTSGNILFLFGRLGSMTVAYLSILAMTKGLEMSVVSHLLIPLVCLVCSFACGFFPGNEVLFIISMIMIMTDNTDSDIITIAGILTPVINAFGLFIDTFAVNMGTNALDTPAQDLEALILK